ncbi:hypothetical protein DFQ26_000306 [Actinomortierella ambigua]|nr:hypothetical protein DFQ26_000306 [Actinomortierella ambigua]
MKVNSPLPKDLADPIAAKGIDNIIPQDILARAKGLAIFTVIKAGFLFSGRAGSGLVVARLDDGSWSAPSAIGTAGMGFGGQIGAELTDFVVVLNNHAAVKSFATGGNVTLGGNLSVAAGPIGRTAEAGAAASTKSVAAIYSYSKSKGLFAGVSIEGSVIAERKDANETFYRQRVSASELLSGAIPPPPQADILYRALNSKASGGMYHYREGSSSGSSANLSRSASVAMAGRYANQGNNSHHSFQQHSTTDEEPVPRYSLGSTPTSHAALAAVTQGDRKTGGGIGGGSAGTLGAAGAGRASLDNNSPFQAAANHQNKPMTNSGAPPRVPPRIGAKPDTVRALYDFAGEQATDLSFKKGDLITVIKKTESRNDWWTGRVHGREGSFPANYTQ